jgi:L-rhamnose mutarotase
MARTHTLGVRLSEEEYTALKEHAAKDYMTPSMKARQILFKAMEYQESARIRAIKKLEGRI